MRLFITILLLGTLGLTSCGFNDNISSDTYISNDSTSETSASDTTSVETVADAPLYVIEWAYDETNEDDKHNYSVHLPIVSISTDELAENEINALIYDSYNTEFQEYLKSAEADFQMYYLTTQITEKDSVLFITAMSYRQLTYIAAPHITNVIYDIGAQKFITPEEYLTIMKYDIEKITSGCQNVVDSIGWGTFTVENKIKGIYADENAQIYIILTVTQNSGMDKGMTFPVLYSPTDEKISDIYNMKELEDIKFLP
jgi:hypothetical protein